MSTKANEFQKAQALVTQERIDKNGRCLFCAAVLKLPKAKIRDFYDAMLDPDIIGPVILSVIQGWGIDTSLTALRHHRSGTHNQASHMATIKKAAGL